MKYMPMPPMRPSSTNSQKSTPSGVRQPNGSARPLTTSEMQMPLSMIAGVVSLRARRRVTSMASA